MAKIAASGSASKKPDTDEDLPKQAVVIVHGMGEQRPMETIRSFVRTVWSEDTSLTPAGNPNSRTIDPETKKPINKSWITPDLRAGSHELRRITTPRDAKGRRADFYELYWADITQGTTRQRLYAWVYTLLWRSLKDVPENARKLYWATWVATVVVLLAAIALATSIWQGCIGPVGAALLTLLASLIFWAIDRFALPYFGDVASYVRAEASTVEKRAEVRERGLSLLRKLMDDPDYDRIIVVGHSLGSVIAYDLLQILWAEYRPKRLEAKAQRGALDAILDVEKFATVPDAKSRLPAERSAYRAAQWRLYEQLRFLDTASNQNWKISDFVTLGSPLTHAEFLLTHNQEKWLAGVADRTWSLCPPLSDSDSEPRLLYESSRNPETNARQRAVHHGATFAATRWTNIYDEGNYLTSGDPISGALSENFGDGVEDVRVVLWRGKSRIFTHTLYWNPAAHAPEFGVNQGVAPHIEALRNAMDLTRSQENPAQ